jgi:hypothetical protein
MFWVTILACSVYSLKKTDYFLILTELSANILAAVSAKVAANIVEFVLEICAIFLNSRQ